MDGEEFHKPYYFLLNMVVDGTFTGVRNLFAAPLPADLVIDYIRDYQNGHTTSGGP